MINPDAGSGPTRSREVNRIFGFELKLPEASPARVSV